MHHVTGSCHCGNVELTIGLSRAPAQFAPRVCDCDFCRKHGASYVSDPEGTLVVEVRDPDALVRYRQGSGQAQMLVCGVCGVLIGGLYEKGDQRFAAVNVRTVDGEVLFGNGQPVSPQRLGPDEKTGRWEQLWFRDVSIRHAAT